MNKIIISMFLILIINSFLICQELFVKRTILIIPSYNENVNDTTNDFLSFLIRDTLRARLEDKKVFNVIKFTTADKKFGENHISSDDYIHSNNFIKIARSLKSDVILLSKFSVSEGNIKISFFTYDIVSEIETIFEDVNGIMDSNVIDYVEKISGIVSEKMVILYPKINKEKLDKMYNFYNKN